MKRALLLTTASLLVSGFACAGQPTVLPPKAKAGAREPADACAVCRKAEEITQLFRKDKAKGVDAAEDFMGKVKFSENASLRDQEIAAVLKLAVLVIPADDEGTTDEYLFDAYEEHTADFDRQINLLPGKDQKIIRNSLAHSKKVSEEGNG